MDRASRSNRPLKRFLTHLDRDGAAQPRVARAEHSAHAACAEERLDLVRPRRPPGDRGSELAGETRRAASSMAGVARNRRRLRLVQQRLHLGLQRGITGARRDQGRRALVPGTCEHLVIQRLDAAPTVGRHGAIIAVRRLRASPLFRRAFLVPSGPATPASSHAFASFQSRITVSTDTFKTAAVSSTLSPPKNRSSITRALRSSTAANASSASSRATRS